MKLKLKTFFIAFIITFITLFSLSIFISATIVKTRTRQSEKNKPQFEFIIPKKQNLNILLTVYENQKQSAKIFEIIKISAHENSITLSSIPENTTTVALTKFGTLTELYSLGGINYAKEAIENLTSIEIDRTIELSKEAVIEIINNLGGFKIPCEKNDKNNVSQIKDNEDYKILDGKQFYNNFKSDPSITLTNLNLTLHKTKNLNQLFTLIQNRGKTNISKYDFEIRKKGFEQMINKNNTTIHVLNLKFENFNDRQKLTNESKNEIEQIFKNNENKI